jgi:hypothetical protein
MMRTVLQRALARAGLVEETRTEALEIFKIALELPAVSTAVLLNVASILGASSLFSEAQECVAKVLRRDLDEPELDEVVSLGNRLALHSGDLAWADTHFAAKSPAREFVDRYDLTAWWPAQQKAVQAILASRTTQFGVFVHEQEGSERLVLAYHTDAFGDELNALSDRVFDAVEDVYASHPDGPGALLGLVIFSLMGPQVPIPRVLQ